MNACGVQIQTALRIRPLLKKERDDTILLEEGKKANTVILNPLQPCRRGRTDPDSMSGNVATEYHFDHILPESTSQDKIYYTLGLPIVTATMNFLKNPNSNQMPKSHLLISMGVENSGKTYTCFGGMSIPKRRGTQDGLVPRLLDSLFSHSSHAGSRSKGFAIQISFMQLTQQNGEQIHDLLANPSAKHKMFGASPKKKKNLNVRNMAARFERAMPSPVSKRNQRTTGSEAVLDAADLKPTIQNCHDISQAREVLQNGLAASQKLNTGNQKPILYVTMQPVVNGTMVGDKVCILDMSGLEKENSVQNNFNQAANDAILNCLRSLKHNSKVMGGNNRTSRKKVETVPFRQHKATMLMNPIFLQSSFVNVTLLLAAYPGHTDFQQKQRLLRDVATFHSMTLDESESEVHDTMNKQMKSKRSEPNDQHEHHNEKRAVHAQYSLRRGERPNYPPKELQFSRASAKVSPSAPRMTKAESVQRSKRDYPPAEPRAEKIMRVEATNVRIVSDSVTKSNVRAYAQKRRDRPSMAYPKANLRKVEPSAPPLSEVQESFVKPRKIDESAVVDFPGLQTTLNSERVAEAGMSSSAKDHLVQASTRSTRNTRETREGISVATNQKRSSPSEEHFARNEFESNRNEELKSPLGKSSLENRGHVIPSKTGKAHGALQRTKDKNFTSQESENTSNRFNTDFPNSEHKMEDKNSEQIKKLEKQLRETLEEKKSLEKICSRLENENTELKHRSRGTGRNAVQSMATRQEEEDFLANRKLRLAAQNPIKAPIHEHLERVNYHYDIKNQWCMTNKKHFSLTFPDHFQRAPALDKRDRETNYYEDLKNIKATKSVESDEIEESKKGLTHMKTKLTPTRQFSPQRVKSPPPQGLSALRRLTGM